MTVKSKVKTTSKQDSHALNVKDQKGKSKTRKLTEVQLSPTILNAITAQSFIASFAGEVDLTEAVTIMQEKSAKINDGDLSGLETTLASQVVSLNAVFNTLARRSASNMGNDLKIVETYMRLALKAQAQCARTIEVLATIKNPPIVYAKQANIAHGHQQINNNQPPAHAGKTINPSNELLNEGINATLDTRGTIEASRANQELATVETVNRRKDSGRQSQIMPERL